jgi:hypothetical protein
MVMVLALLVLAIAGVVQAEERVCRGSLGAITVDNLVVPQNASCTLKGTRVQGTIKVERGATLLASGISVVGNIQAENAARVNVLSNSAVGGSIQIVQSGAAKIDSVKINGDLLFDSNNRSLSANRNTIGGNLQAFQNTGGVSITANRINGNLQCKGNNPAPTGRGNIVQGTKEDQCARL